MIMQIFWLSVSLFFLGIMITYLILLYKLNNEINNSFKIMKEMKENIIEHLK